jgi:CRP-like cAMP-binding protein
VDALVPKTYKDKERIIKQGEKADGMYFVINGNVMLKVQTDSGKEAPVSCHHELFSWLYFIFIFIAFLYSKK